MVPGNPENERFVPWKGVRIFHLPTIILLGFQMFCKFSQWKSAINRNPAGFFSKPSRLGAKGAWGAHSCGLVFGWKLLDDERILRLPSLFLCLKDMCEIMLQFCPFSTTLVAMVPSILPKNVWELVGPRKGIKESRVTQGYTSKGINWQWELLRIPKIIKLPSYISKLDCLLLILSWFPQPKCCFPGTWGKPVSILDQADAKVLSRAYCGSPSPICRCLSFNALRFAFINHPFQGSSGVKIVF